MLTLLIPLITPPKQDETRRLGRHIEQLTTTLGSKIDANDLLSASFSRLLTETGRPSTFSYPELELSVEMRGERARVAAQLNEVEDQLSSLEGENTRLRRALKAQAGAVGEQGVCVYVYIVCVCMSVYIYMYV